MNSAVRFGISAFIIPAEGNPDRRWMMSTRLPKASFLEHYHTKTKYGEAWERPEKVLQTPMSGQLVHYCDGTCQEKGGCVQVVSRALVDVMLHCLPAVPERGKWAKACPMMAFLIGGWALWSMMPKTWEAAFDRHHEKKKPRPPSEDVVVGPELQDWGEVFSKRATIAQGFLTSRASMLTTTVFWDHPNSPSFS